MTRNARALAMVLALAAAVAALACGAGAEEGGGADNLPTRLAGPYGKLPDDPRSDLDEPKVIEAQQGDVAYYGPSALAEPDGSHTVYFTADDGTDTVIQRAQGVDLANPPTAVDTVLIAGEAWEASRVAHPTLIVPGLNGPYGMFYEAGSGEIGYASSSDGRTFQKHPGNPLLSPDLVEEGARIGQPAAVWAGDMLLLYYEAADVGSIFLATLDVAGGRFEKVDADPLVPGHDAVLGPNPFAGASDEAAVGGPMVRATNHAGRFVYDMWYTAWRADGDTTVGFAGSYDGLLFKRFEENPVLPPGIPLEAEPWVVTQSVTAIMFYTQGEGQDRAIGAAIY